MSLGVTPSGKTLDAVKNSISSVSNNSYNTGYAKGKTDGYYGGIAAARCKITAVVGFVGGNPDDVASHQGMTLYGTLEIIVSNGRIESQSWTKTHNDELSGGNMYYQTAKIWSITVTAL